MPHATLTNSSAWAPRKKTSAYVETTRKNGTASLTEDRWAEFVRDDWEKNATVLKGALSTPLVSDQSMFAALLQVSRAYRNGHAENKLSFWIDGRKIQELTDYLPVASDKSVPGYVRRLDRQLRGSEFTLLVADPHIYDYNLWNVARRFLRGLYTQVGMPCGGVDSTFFIGRYKRTPFGVHRGQMSVMTFPVHAEKRFRTWPRGYGEAHPEIESLLDYPDHEQVSSELIGNSQDVLYWPADIWHIAEGSEQFTSTFNIGFWWDRPPLTRVLFEMSRRLAEKLNTSDFRGFTLPDKFSNGYPLAAQVDSSIHEAIGLTRHVLADEDIDTSLALNSMRTISADAFRDVPALQSIRECSSSPTDLLCADPHSRFLFGQHNGTLYIAANGNLFSVQPHLETLLRDLQSGNPMLRRHAVKVGGSEFVWWLERARVLRTMNAAKSAD
jgi:hypothetical protein